MTASALAVTAAALAAAAAALVTRRGWGRRRGLPAPPSSASAAPGEVGTSERDRPPRHHVLLVVLAGVAPLLLLGGVAGWLAAPVAAFVVHRVLAGREPATVRRRREQVVRDLPQVVDLLAVALAAGSAPPSALAAVLSAVDGPVSEELATVRQGLVLGRDPVTVWRELAGRPGLAALARTMVRAVESGAPVVDALHLLAEDLRSVGRAEAETRARTVGVRAAVPLGVCLLPAFLLVGVVPLVAGVVGALIAR